MLVVMNDIIQTHRKWVQWLARREGKKLTPLAIDAGLSSTTLTRSTEVDFAGFLPRTISKVVKFYNVPPPDVWALGFSENDVSQWHGPSPEFKIEKYRKKSSGLDTWIVETDVLASVGIKRGDQIIVDLNINSLSKGLVNGDIVVAQQHDVLRGSAKTLLRLYNREILTVATMTGGEDEILYVQSGTVTIMGVVTARLWLRGDN
jgi:hypothetical protein